MDKTLQASIRGKYANLPDWGPLLAAEPGRWDQALRGAEGGPRILIATTVGGGTSTALSGFESLLAVALTLRGARVSILLCDQSLPACMNLEKETTADDRIIGSGNFNQTEFCRECRLVSGALFAPLQLPVERLSTWLGPAERAELAALARAVPVAAIPDFRHDGCPIGEHAQAGALRYFARGDLEGEPEGESVLRRYLEAALLTQAASRRVMAHLRPEVVVCSHGLYVPFGVIGAMARLTGRRFVAWNFAYRKQCTIFSHGDSYHHTMLDESAATWSEQPWDDSRESRLMDYLDSRIHGTHDWIWFHEKPHEQVDGLFARLGVKPGLPLTGLLTNVIWDAQLHYRTNAFPCMMAWLLASIDYFAAHPDRQLLIRIHPAEIRGTIPSRQRVGAEIARRWPRLPGNVFVVAAEEPVSTYALMRRCGSVAIYGTKTGVELACYGARVIVAGEAWIRNKGFSIDATSPEHYRKILDEVPGLEPLDEETRTLARKYAYHFFFRRMIPVSHLQPAAGWPPYRVAPRPLQELVTGDPGLDTICDGILTGAEFVHEPAAKTQRAGELTAP